MELKLYNIFILFYLFIYLFFFFWGFSLVIELNQLQMGDAASQTAAVICAALTEFYSGNTSNPVRYAELDRFISDLYSCKFYTQ